jgi:hypothetical protein
MLRAALVAAVAVIGFSWSGPEQAQAQGAPPCTPGAKLDAQSGGRWYPATVKQGPDAQGRCFISYDGWSANWDEWLPPAQLRRQSGPKPAGIGAAYSYAPVASTPAAGGGGASLPDGRYACRIWIGSMLSTLGKVDIKGRTYRGPSHTPSGAYKPFSVVNGQIQWEPNFSQLAATGARITGTRVSAGGRGFEVDYLTARGNRESMECSPE